MSDISFGKYLASKRGDRGLSQRALAVQADVKNSTISRLEADIVRPDPQTLAKLSNALGIDKWELHEKCGYSDIPKEVTVIARKTGDLSKEAQSELYLEIDAAIDAFLKKYKGD